MPARQQSQWHHIQRSMAGGEVSPQMLLRGDTDEYQQSVLLMENFIPNQLGGADRAPGTRFVEEVEDLDARITSYLTQSNERSLIIFTPLKASLRTSVGETLGPQYTAQVRIANTIIGRKQIIPNGEFDSGGQDPKPWVRSVAQYYSNNGEGPLGIWQLGVNAGGQLAMSARDYKPVDQADIWVTTTAEVDVPTDTITVIWDMFLRKLWPESEYTFTAEIRDTDENGAIIDQWTFTGEEGTTWADNVSVGLPTAGWTGTLWIKLRLLSKPTADSDNVSSAGVRVERFQIWANSEVEETIEDLTTPYTAEDLKDLHFVQSPYGFPDGFKELVITHPKHPPARIYFDSGGGTYVYEVIPFTGDTAPVWSVNNYPATCSSLFGRLVLAGGQSFRTAPGDPITSTTETIWMTKVGDWDTFSASNEVNPDDSIELVTTYRSPIQWVYGQKTLLVGALEMEYIVSADGIYSPADLGADMHSTHGSKNVQPVAMGEGVFFAGDAGRSCRMMNFDDQTQGWVSEELSFFVPELLNLGIRRMVRIRNPHQMVMVLLEAGIVAIMHLEGGLKGWSRLLVNGGNIEDICVVPNDDGIDIPYLTVTRTVGGQQHLYLEAIPNWVDGGQWDYLGSSVTYQNLNSHILTGLDHLEGQVIQVSGDRMFRGSFTVTGGQVEVVDQIGNPIKMTSAVAGMAHPCKIVFLPPDKHDPGAKSRFSDIAVRCTGSTRPIINGERPADRDPDVAMHLSQGLDLYTDHQITNLGWFRDEFVTVEENVPLRTSVLGLYGKLTANTP